MAEVDSDEDLTKELEPLAYYVSDRKRVLREALRTLKGKRLEAMIPPVLKSWERPRLESACLNILEDLDDETILAILDGRIGTAASAAVEQPVPDEEPVKEKPKKIKNKVKKIKSGATVEGVEEPKKKKKKKAVATLDPQDEAKLAKLKKKRKLLKAKKLKEKLKKKKKAASTVQPAPTEGDPTAVPPHKSLMELLELEYRAKAIKALLRSQGQTVPDIPLEVEDEEQEENTPVNLTEPPAPAKTEEKTNGVCENKSKPTASPVRKGSPKKSGKRDPKISSPLPEEKPCPKKSSPKKVEPKKAVIDLIDDALNTSLTEVNPNDDVPAVEAPTVIVEAIGKTESGKEEDLRTKLLQKYQQQKQEVQNEPSIVKKKRKKKKVMPKEDDEDVLDLHPRELSLSDDEGAEEEESSGEEETEDENQEEENVTTKDAQVEELIYDGTDEEDIDELINTQQKEVQEDEENSNLSNQENSLWAAVEEGNKVDEKGSNTTDNETSQGGPPSENSRSGAFSETTRDDVFESVEATTDSKSKATVAGMFGNLSSQRGIKKPLTLRIDPARIKALKDQGAEEEAKREEERKREEEEERLRQQELEPEEGEIDSNEENATPTIGSETNKLKADVRLRKSPSKSPSRSMKQRDSSDSEDSQDSSSYYARRRPYKRKHKSPNRDFGKYSPEKNVQPEKKDEETKRPSSPVDFITQYSDMEPISDEDSNLSQPTKKMGPLQGCAEKPLGSVESEEEKEDLKKLETEDHEENESGPEEDEDDDLPKPVTWYERWAQSHGMSKVAKANKIHKKVKSKLKQEKTQTKKQPEAPKIPEPSVEQEPIIGSIEEYEKLFGKKVVVKSSEEENSKSNDAQEEEEEEADDLWGDILGGS